MKVATRFIVAGTLVGILGALSATSVATQSVDIPSTWIDISDRAPALDDLANAARQAATTDAFWVGYIFPLRRGAHVDCDDRRGRGVTFGSDDIRLHLDDAGDDVISMSCDDDIGLFLRFDGSTSEVAEVRMSTLRRAATRLAGAVVWAGDYDPAESVAFLRPAVLRVGGEAEGISAASVRARERLLTAIAVHDSEAALDVVAAGLNPVYPESLRESAVFWTAQVGGERGVVLLLDLARNDDAEEIRKQSIFWLGQLAGERATASLAEIATDDPDTDVRTTAVFALSQSDDDAAVDALVRIVRTHDNPEVVKAALFWLGQSGDPRAIELFEQILFGGRG